MAKLSAAELRVIRALLERAVGTGSSLLRQVEDLEFDARHMTGTGYYIHFDNAEMLPCLDIADNELSEDYRTNRKAPCDLVGFTLFIRDGYLSSFEGYTFGDVEWPADFMESWPILDAA